MKRREIVNHVRYLTFSCYHRLPLLQNDKIKDLFLDRLMIAKNRHGFALFAYVVMPEHVHLLLRPNLPLSSVSASMRSFKLSVAQRVLHRWQELHAPILQRVTDSQGSVHFWQAGGGYDRNIITYDELIEKIQYVHDNPRRRGLVVKGEQWAWSSAQWYAGQRNGPVKIDPID